MSVDPGPPACLIIPKKVLSVGLSKDAHVAHLPPNHIEDVKT